MKQDLQKYFRSIPEEISTQWPAEPDLGTEAAFLLASLELPPKGNGEFCVLTNCPDQEV